MKSSFNRLEMLKRSKLNQKGQISFFVALAFQVLFVFFAMVVNVGMLVHHKINLQNSVDLAAYYGAMKQSQMMNAIAHVNYQIRQAYKLLMFRYHVVGTAGLDSGVGPNLHPYRQPIGPNPGEVLLATDEPVQFPSNFCLGYPPFNNVGMNESYCRKPATAIPLPASPDLLNNVTGALSVFFGSTAALLQSAAQRFNEDSKSGCRVVSELNWYMLASYIAAYKMDVANRKRLAIFLANKVSAEDPFDLEGKPIKEGVFQTLSRNLTRPNRESLGPYDPNSNLGGNATAEFAFINGLSEGGCGGTGNIEEAPNWLVDIAVYNKLFFTDGRCNETDFINLERKQINIGGGEVSVPDPSRGYQVLNPDIIRNLKVFTDETSGNTTTDKLFRSSIGFEKNPWCVAYIGVKAKTTPIIPFAPLGAVTLEAKSFAKPFGGKIGPWFSKTWSPGANTSDVTDDATRYTDPNSPFRVIDGRYNFLTNTEDNRFKEPSYGRYLGDQKGIRTNLSIANLAKPVFEQGAINVNYWTHFLENEIGEPGKEGDPLAWDKVANTAPNFRDLEISAVSPDHFDISHYSIEPDFYNNYLLKIRQSYGSEFPKEIRGDLGSRADRASPLRSFSVIDQIKKLKGEGGRQVLDINNLTYLVTDPGSLLTGWITPDPDQTDTLDAARFGRCLTPVVPRAGNVLDAPDPATNHSPGMCVAGGRTGYSVKLVSEKYFTRSLELGGEGMTGAIKNPPPNNF